VDRCREGRDSIREAKESSENWTNSRVGFVVEGFEEVVGVQERISRRKIDAVRSGDAWDRNIYVEQEEEEYGKRRVGPIENSRKSRPYSRRLMRKKRMIRICVVLLLLVRMTATKNIVLMMTLVNTRMENRMIQTRELAVEEESSGREIEAEERFRRKCCGSKCGVSWNCVSPGTVTVASSVEIMVILECVMCVCCRADSD